MGGILVEQMTKGTPHDYSLGVLGDHLRALLVGEWIVREDKSLRLGPRSRPEPDLAVVAGPLSLYKQRDPIARDVAMIAEVAESSYPYDRGRKWRRYASAGIPIYWIVNLSKRQVEVFREPTGASAQAANGQTEIFGEDDAIPVVIAGLEVGRVNVRDILP